ncbi:unnamed protein product [marine sediment metagenome]|uniref:Uncharacterized protein n=1 Tax=marine sediment metagenome TaxID=412755 RepID=X1V095_9ZZZZ
MPEKIKRFGDMKPPPLPCDEKIDVTAILDQDVLWEDFQELSGKTGLFMWIVVSDLESKRKLGFSCGGKVVMSKLNEAKERRLLPLVGKLVKVKDYYDIL